MTHFLEWTKQNGRKHYLPAFSILDIELLFFWLFNFEKLLKVSLHTPCKNNYFKTQQ